MAKTLTFGPYGQMREGHPLRERRPPSAPFWPKVRLALPYPSAYGRGRLPLAKGAFGHPFANPYGRGGGLRPMGVGGGPLPTA